MVSAFVWRITYAHKTIDSHLEEKKELGKRDPEKCFRHTEPRERLILALDPGMTDVADIAAREILGAEMKVEEWDFSIHTAECLGWAQGEGWVK